MRRLLVHHHFAAAASLMGTALRLAGLGAAGANTSAAATPGPVRASCGGQEQPQPQQQQGPQEEEQGGEQAPHDLFGVLLHAAQQPAAAASGLTADLAASFVALMPRLASEEQAQKVIGAGLGASY